MPGALIFKLDAAFRVFSVALQLKKHRSSLELINPNILYVCGLAKLTRPDNPGPWNALSLLPEDINIHNEQWVSSSTAMAT